MSSVDGKPSSPLKRARSDSSSIEDAIPYQPTPGARYGKDSLVCDQCGLAFRKHSDLKKHHARHSRSYRCVEEGCPRSQIGFATINDLYRHEKSVHGKHVGKSRMYRCFAPGCAKASKLWPRLDNFKQHLIRMHPAEDVEALVKISEQCHAEEEGDGMSQGPDGHTQDSVINSLQNVKRLRSPPRPLGVGPSQLGGDRPLSRRWDLTPPTPAANQDRRTDLRQILTEPGRQPLSNGERPIQPTPTPAMQPPPPPPSSAPPAQPPPPPTDTPMTDASSSTSSTLRRPQSLEPQPTHQNPQHQGPLHHPPRLQPSSDTRLSHLSVVRELSTEARCRSCVWENRRCYVDQSNPRHCVSCRSREECIFRRTVIRDAPADFFTWGEIVGVEHLVQGNAGGNVGGGGQGQGQGREG